MYWLPWLKPGQCPDYNIAKFIFDKQGIVNNIHIEAFHVQPKPYVIVYPLENMP